MFDEFDDAIDAIDMGAGDIETALGDLELIESDLIEEAVEPFVTKINQALKLIAEANKMIPDIKKTIKAKLASW